MKLRISILTAAVALALAGCAAEQPVLATGTNSPTADESMPAPGDRSATSGAPTAGPNYDPNAPAASGSSRSPNSTSSPTADESKQAPGDRTSNTGEPSASGGATTAPAPASTAPRTNVERSGAGSPAEAASHSGNPAHTTGTAPDPVHRP